MSVQISRILHAAYLFENDQTTILFDPIFENPFSQNCYAFPEVRFEVEEIKKIKFSAIFISHFHDDHCSLESLNLIDRSTPIYIFCIFEELIELIKELGFSNVYSLKLSTSIKIDNIEVTPLKALDADVDSIFHIKVEGLNILNVVDSWIDEDTLQWLLKQGVWDLILWPFQTMREIEVLAPTRVKIEKPEIPSEWLHQLQLLHPRYIVPSSCQFIHESWSWYNQTLFPITYAYFQKKINEILPHTEVIRMNPSCRFELDSHKIIQSTSLNWITPIGNQNVDYEYNPNLKPQTTQEISQKLRALDRLQSQRVLNYCEDELPSLFQSFEQSTESYFEKPLVWRLSVYDQQGKVQNFYYQIHQSRIENIKNPTEPLGWTTEIPLAKFYAALEWGESLTSLYIRINDYFFVDEIEKKIAWVDIIEDPLIRCLFTNKFASYQKVQLKRLKSRASF